MQAAKLNHIAYGQLRKEKTKEKRQRWVHEEYDRDMQMSLLEHILDIMQLSIVKEKVRVWVTE